MPLAYIYQPASSPTQSGRGREKWVLEFEPSGPPEIEQPARPVFILTEDGLGTLAAPYTEKHAFRSLIVDSADWLEPLIHIKVCQAQGCGSIEDLGYGKGYVHALDYWRQYLEGVNALRDDKGMAIIQITHTDIKRFDTETGITTTSFTYTSTRARRRTCSCPSIFQLPDRPRGRRGVHAEAPSRNKDAEPLNKSRTRQREGQKVHAKRKYRGARDPHQEARNHPPKEFAGNARDQSPHAHQHHRAQQNPATAYRHPHIADGQLE